MSGPSGRARAPAVAPATGAPALGSSVARGGARPALRDPLTSSPPRSGSLLGIHVPPEVEQGGLLLSLTLLCGMLVIALVVGDAAGIGPRHKMWRARLSERLGRR